MIKYKINFKNNDFIINLNTTDIDKKTPINVEETNEEVLDLKEWLGELTGAFGHLIGSSTTPMDLDAALRKQKEHKWELIEGETLVKQYKPKFSRSEIQT